MNISLLILSLFSVDEICGTVGWFQEGMHETETITNNQREISYLIFIS